MMITFTHVDQQEAARTRRRGQEVVEETPLCMGLVGHRWAHSGHDLGLLA